MKKTGEIAERLTQLGIPVINAADFATSAIVELNM